MLRFCVIETEESVDGMAAHRILGAKSAMSDRGSRKTHAPATCQSIGLLPSAKFRRKLLVRTPFEDATKCAGECSNRMNQRRRFCAQPVDHHNQGEWNNEL